VPIYEVPAGGGSVRLATRSGRPEPRDEPRRRVAFFAPDRPGIAGIPVYEESDPAGGRALRVGSGPGSAGGSGPPPLFYLLPDDRVAASGVTVRLFEYQNETGGRRLYSVEAPGTRVLPGGGARILGRVWPNPAAALRW
jgi:hypothetical protein